MKRKLILLVLVLFNIGMAQETKKSYNFTLKEAIAHALENNYAAINSSRDIEAAKKKKWETTTIGLPQINSNINYQNNLVIQKSVVPAEFFGGNPGEFQEVEFGVKHNMTANASLNQLLFDGSYLVGLQSAKTYLKISENAKEKTNQEIKEIVINSYGNVLLADESILIINKNKSVLEKILSDTKEIYKNGLIEEETIEQLQITLNSVNNALENVTKQRVIALNMVKLLLGINLDDDIVLTEKLSNLTQNNIVFPNPVKNDLNIQNVQLNDVIKITDLSGKTIQTIENKQSQSILNIDVKALKTGIYQFQLIRNGIQPIVQTFIKE